MGVGSGGSLRDAPRRVQFGKPTSAGKGRLAGAGTEIEWEGASRPRPLTPPSMRVRTRQSPRLADLQVAIDETDETLVTPVGVRQNAVQRAGGHAPRPFARVGQFVHPPLREAERTRPQAVAEPTIQRAENPFGVRQRVVPEPSVHITGDSAYALLHRDAPVAARQVPQLLLEPMDALRR